MYLLLLQRQWRTIALYVTVFLGVFLLIAVLNSGNGEYQAQQIRVVLRNEDDSEVSEVLSDALQERFVVEEGLGDTEMDEALFYQGGGMSPSSFRRDSVMRLRWERERSNCVPRAITLMGNSFAVNVISFLGCWQRDISCIRKRAMRSSVKRSALPIRRYRSR